MARTCGRLDNSHRCFFCRRVIMIFFPFIVLFLAGNLLASDLESHTCRISSKLLFFKNFNIFQTVGNMFTKFQKRRTLSRPSPLTECCQRKMPTFGQFFWCKIYMCHQIILSCCLFPLKALLQNKETLQQLIKCKTYLFKLPPQF